MTAPKKKPPTPTSGWWSNVPERWPAESDATYARWHKNTRDKSRFDEAFAKSAMQFGFGARDEYGEHRPWKDLVDQLRTDWHDAGFEAQHAWDDVVNVVKAGWTAGSMFVEPVVEKADKAEPAHADSSASHEPSHLLPGQRPHLS